MSINLHNNRHAFAVWAGVTIAGASVSFGLVAASGNLATAVEPSQPAAWEASHTVESLSVPTQPVDVQRVCRLWDDDTVIGNGGHWMQGRIFHTPDALCESFGFMDTVTLEVGALGLGLQNSYEHCATNDGWGDNDCVLADRYGAAFVGSWIYNG